VQGTGINCETLLLERERNSYWGFVGVCLIEGESGISQEADREILFFFDLSTKG
jgi:hypothetical protein